MTTLQLHAALRNHGHAPLTDLRGKSPEDMLAMAMRMMNGKNAMEVIMHFMEGQKMAQETADHLLHQANIDSLSGLYNKRAFETMATHELSRRARNDAHLGLIVIDLSGFKAINDNYGHGAGDTVLQFVASKLLSTIRESDIVARVGGDEFVVMLPDTDQAGVMHVQKKLESMFDTLTLEHSDNNNQPISLNINASIGHAMYDHGMTLDQLFEKADASMYVAKKSKAGYTPRVV